MKSFNVFVLFFVLTAVLSFFGACSKKDVSDGSNAAEVNDLKTEIEDLRNQVQSRYDTPGILIFDYCEVRRSNVR